MFAYRRPVRAGALQLDLVRRGKKAGFLASDDPHHMVGEAPAQQLDQRADRARALVAKPFPLRLGCRGDADLDLVQLLPANRRLDLARPDRSEEHTSEL